jgi:hypothetical protein
MPAFDSADMAAFFDPDMPGYALAEVKGASVSGILRQPRADAFGIVEGNAFSFVGLETDLSEIREGDISVIANREFTIGSVRREYPGMITLSLML